MNDMIRKDSGQDHEMTEVAAKTYKTIDPDTLARRDAYLLNVSLLVPRPIAWVGTLGFDGIPNCAPFSFFMGVSSAPPVVAFAVGQKRTGPKDTVRNIEHIPEFTVNICNEELGQKMVQTSHDYAHDVSEFAETGLKAVASECIKPPRIGGAPIQMECRLHHRVDVADTSTTVIFGRVVRYHIATAVLNPDTGLVDIRLLKPLGRLGGIEYCRVHDILEITKSAD